MYKDQYPNIFNEPQGSQNYFQEVNFLEVDDLFDVSIFRQQQHDIFVDSNEDNDIESFSSQYKSNTFVQPSNQLVGKKPKKFFKSSQTKNACYNICQKTIKVIQKGIFDKKLIQICQNNGIEMSKFKQLISSKKKQFTGPKALLNYFEKKNKQTITFSSFMKWFLSQKYLRMAINQGQMKNLKIYIQFKNISILPLLQ